MSLRNPEVEGQCPACGSRTLFLGDGGHITCSWIDCSDPGAVDKLLSPAFVDYLTFVVQVLAKQQLFAHN